MILHHKIHARQFDALRQVFRRTSKGSAASELDLLEGLVALAKDDDQLASLGYDQEALEDFAREHEKYLLASLHIHEQVNHQVRLGADGITLKALYEEAVVKTTSVLQALRQLAMGAGSASILQWRSFLNNAVAADLGALDVGADKVHLELLLVELKGLRIFNALTYALKNLEKERLRREENNLFGLTLDYIEQPYVIMPQFERWVQACCHQDQILFFQDYRNIYQSIPEEAYVSEEQKVNSKRVLQERIDELIYSE
jgi:hypothetical protein